MQRNPRISIILPVYNDSSYLSEALNSVINQTYNNLEIIIVDDGSVDGSAQICDEYEKIDKRICVIHQNNKGLSAARNVGLSHMTGDYVVFLDSDDKFHIEYCQKMLEVITQNEADIVICKAKTVANTSTGELQWDNSGVPYPPLLQGVYSREESLRNLTKGLINHSVWNKIYRSSLWQDIRFPIGHVYEDVDVTFRIINCCKKICVLDEILYLRRQHSGSITDICSQKNITDFLWSFAHYESFVASNIPDVFEICHLESVHRYKLVQIIIFYIRLTHNKNRGNKYFLKSLRRHIIKLGKEVDLGNRNTRIIVGYWIIRLCPSLIYRLSPIYYRLFRS